MALLCFIVAAVFDLTVQMYGGMRGIRALVTETSLLDPEEVRQSSELTVHLVFVLWIL